MRSTQFLKRSIGWVAATLFVAVAASCAQNGGNLNLPGGLSIPMPGTPSPSSPAAPAAPAPSTNSQSGSGWSSQNRAAAQCGVVTAAASYAECTYYEKKPARICVPRSIVLATGGALICHMVDDALVKRNQELAGHENELKAQVEYMRGVNQDVAESNRQMQTAIEDTKKRTDALADLKRQGQATQQDIARERKVQDDDLASARRRLDQQKAALAEVKRFKAQQRQSNPDLDAEYDKQTKLYAVTQQQVTELAALRQRV